jgi:hypothetical protein
MQHFHKSNVAERETVVFEQSYHSCLESSAGSGSEGPAPFSDRGSLPAHLTIDRTASGSLERFRQCNAHGFKH